MKKYLLLFVLFAFSANAQVHRFIYEYKYVPNIKQKDTIRKDLMALDIGEKGSVYQSLTKLTNDSLRQIEISKMVQSGGGMRNLNFRSTAKKGVVPYKVVKDYPDYKSYLVDRVGAEMYKIAEDEKIVWKIVPETQKIGEYKAQKATTDFGGRSWIAWFSTDLPFQEGPYKFSGLPGLIVKIEDTTGSHNMLLVANKKIKAVETKDEEIKGSSGITRISFNQKEIPITEAQFKKVWKNYITDPSKDLRNLSSGSSGDGIVRVSVMMGPDGKQIDPNEMAKMREKAVKSQLETDNNKIEPTLFDNK